MDAAAQKLKLEEQPAPIPAEEEHHRLLANEAVGGFELTLQANHKDRTEHPDEPALFMNSELALHEETDRLRVLARAPQLFPFLLRRDLHVSLSKLLTHDNPDLVAAGASLINELISSPDLMAAKFMADALLSAGALQNLVHDLFRFSDEAEAVHHCLVLLHSFLDLRPFLANTVCQKTDILAWLRARVEAPGFEENKRHASEILAILLQSSPANRLNFGGMNWVDTLLKAIALYKSRDPETTDEEEMLHNLFNSLCCVLMPVESKELFVKAQGVELMLCIIKERKSAYGSAIRTLDFAMTRFPSACERFVDVRGLKTAFAVFMGKIPVNKKNKNESSQEDLISLIASLFGGITKGPRRIRLLGKFLENECEKIDRLMELYTRYSDRVKAETERLESLDLGDMEMNDDERYNQKLEAGLYTLQLVTLILGHIWLSGNSQMRKRIEFLLRQNKLTKDDIKDILQEYHNSIGDLDGPEEKAKTKGMIKEIIAIFV